MTNHSITVFIIFISKTKEKSKQERWIDLENGAPVMEAVRYLGFARLGNDFVKSRITRDIEGLQALNVDFVDFVGTVELIGLKVGRAVLELQRAWIVREKRRVAPNYVVTRVYLIGIRC